MWGVEVSEASEVCEAGEVCEACVEKGCVGAIGCRVSNDYNSNIVKLKDTLTNNQPIPPHTHTPHTHTPLTHAPHTPHPTLIYIKTILHTLSFKFTPLSNPVS